MAIKLSRVVPKKALNAAFLKVRPLRSEMDNFKSNLINLLDKINENESEENQKNHIRDFLLNTYYQGKNEVNTKGRQDLVIHIENKNTSPVGVIVEAKRPANKSEWMTADKPNAKALHELILYFLRERVDGKNNDIRYVIATNVYEWYIFDATVFDKIFYQNKKLVRDYEAWRDGQKVTKDTNLFYNEIAKPFLESVSDEIPATFFDLRDYEKELRNADKADDKKLIALQKLLSPFHLLRQSFANDSNSLDKQFYSELLHIIGLTETKDKGKKLIGRHKAGERHTGSIIEDAIIQIESLDKLPRIDRPSQYGDDKEERLFNIALELSITWINRILFLKLLEGQLVSYHKGDASYLFLHSKIIKEYDDLNTLFFQVLAKKHEDRNADVKQAFAKVPYLNSSLFEPTELEHQGIFISNLRDDKTIPVHSQTVLKDGQGKKRTGSMTTLHYLFEFLNAYDFSSEGSEDIQEDNKTLINASVLGLIFEKINGYKDGSFFTPGFITMYMCRETIRRAVVQKFNEAKSWSCEGLTDVYNKIEDTEEANKLVDSLHICDPAVGSGHFLVSALNEIIAIKSELGILRDREGKRLRDYTAEVINDELIIKDENGDLFTYNPKNAESQRVQKTLFHEKQTLIENCLFGVDINPNSVKICRLRLWIELLKNAYYKGENELETLPNIDINIKCGNSLVSRFALDADLKSALKKTNLTIDGYRFAVSTYRSTKSRETKREMENLILQMKQKFSSEIRLSDPNKKKLDKLANELYHRFTGTFLFEPEESYGKKGDELEKKKKAEQEKLEKEIAIISQKIEESKNNVIYNNSFEWRFEFPEVLNDDGDFVGFDVVIGNPPYIRQEEFKELKEYLSNNFEVYNSTADLYAYFINLSFNILKENGSFSFIIPNKWMKTNYGENLRKYISQRKINYIIDFGDLQVFEEATTYPSLLLATNKKADDLTQVVTIESLAIKGELNEFIYRNKKGLSLSNLDLSGWEINNIERAEIINKIKEKSVLLSEFVGNKFFYGIKTGFNEAFVVDLKTKLFLEESDSMSKLLIKPLLTGKDIKRYIQPKVSKFIILTEKGVEIEQYPGIYNHLSKFKEKLDAKAGNNKWFELQASPGDKERFEKAKIMYPDISKDLNFILDFNQNYSLNTVYNIESDSMGLLGYLNSKLFLFYFQTVSNSIRGGYLRFFTEYMKNAPVLKGIEILEPVVNQILSLKSQDPTADTSALEAKIDEMVYDLYGLTEEERKIVEGA